MRSEEIYNRIQQIREEKNITVEELEEKNGRCLL
jgi:transcriptional regulator with XRE-family HTH domain